MCKCQKWVITTTITTTKKTVDILTWSSWWSCKIEINRLEILLSFQNLRIFLPATPSIPGKPLRKKIFFKMKLTNKFSLNYFVENGKKKHFSPEAYYRYSEHENCYLKSLLEFPACHFFHLLLSHLVRLFISNLSWDTTHKKMPYSIILLFISK